MSLEDFIEAENDQQSGLLIVDFSQIVLSTIMSTFRPNESLSVDLIRHVVLNTIRSNVLKHRTEYPDVVLATDKGPYWRKRIAPYYKGNRKQQRDDSEWDFGTIFDALNVIREELNELFPYRTMQIPGVEADDIAGVLVYRIGHKYNKIMLISSDGDWAQLQKFKHVKQWSPIQKKWVVPKNGSAHLHLMEKVIKGDRKDAVANIKSVSDAVLLDERQKSIFKAELDKWMVEPVEEWGDEFMIKRYYENIDLLDLSKIPDDIADQIMVEFNKPTASGAKIYPYLVKHKMKELLGRVQEFI